MACRVQKPGQVPTALTSKEIECLGLKLIDGKGKGQIPGLLSDDDAIQMHLKSGQTLDVLKFSDPKKKKEGLFKLLFQAATSKCNSRKSCEQIDYTDADIGRSIHVGPDGKITTLMMTTRARNSKAITMYKIGGNRRLTRKLTIRLEKIKGNYQEVGGEDIMYAAYGKIKSKEIKTFKDRKEVKIIYWPNGKEMSKRIRTLNDGKEVETMYASNGIKKNKTITIFKDGTPVRHERDEFGMDGKTLVEHNEEDFVDGKLTHWVSFKYRGGKLREKHDLNFIDGKPNKGTVTEYFKGGKETVKTCIQNPKAPNKFQCQ